MDPCKGESIAADKSENTMDQEPVSESTGPTAFGQEAVNQDKDEIMKSNESADKIMDNSVGNRDANINDMSDNKGDLEDHYNALIVPSDKINKIEASVTKVQEGAASGNAKRQDLEMKNAKENDIREDDITKKKTEIAVASKPMAGVATIVTSASVTGTPLGTPERGVDYVAFSQQKLTGLFFSGQYVDRVWVDPVSGYRDRIVVDPQESAAVKVLKSVHRKGRKAVPQFVGIQRNDTEVSLLSNWRQPTPALGHYWFLVDRVLFHKFGFDLAVRILRSREDDMSFQPSRKSCPNCHYKLDSDDINDDSTLSVSDIANNWQQQFKDLVAPDEWWTKVRPYLTFANLVKSLKLLLLLCLAAVTGLVAFIQNIIPMLNKTLLALGTVIQKSTPFMLGCLDTINKVIGATFLMINRLWADLYHGPKTNLPPPQPSRPAIDLPGTRYWARQNLTDRDADRSSTLRALEGPTPRYPYLRSDIKRPYLRGE